MAEMLFTLLLICLIHTARGDADLVARCSDTPETDMTFTAVPGIPGRYIAELCTHMNFSSRQEWELNVNYHEKRGHCDWTEFPATRHSRNVEHVMPSSCSTNQTACVSAQFDLIFGACYEISSTFPKVSSRPHYAYFNITNNLTRKKIAANTALYFMHDYVTYMTFSWQPGFPISGYVVQLHNNSNLYESFPTNCSLGNNSLECVMNPPVPGCYELSLRHIAPWISGLFIDLEINTYEFCRNSSSVPPVQVSLDAGLWAWSLAGGGALLAAAAVFACLLRRHLAAARNQQAVKRWWQWLFHARSEGEPGAAAGQGAGEGASRRHVLLLYARECPAFARAVAALKQALEHVVDGQVYDLFSPEVTSLSACAPAEWVRGVIARADTRVVLLQSPALHALYATAHRDDAEGIRLMSPLLSRRCVPRRPHPGDSLLQYALRIAASSPAQRSDYNKYHIASISSLQSEVVPDVVPFRRYCLPDLAGALLADVAGVSAVAGADEALDAFTRALAEFVEYAGDNPHYLMDELVLIDS